MQCLHDTIFHHTQLSSIYDYGEKQYSVPTKFTVIPKLNVVTGVRATSAGDNYINISWNKYPKTNVTGVDFFSENVTVKLLILTFGFKLIPYYAKHMIINT